MLSPERALELIVKRTPTLGARAIPLRLACGRVLAEDVFARGDLPPFDSAAMDGFAVRVRDCGLSDERAALELGATLRAGRLASVEVKRRQALRIMTGAPMPKGADAVVMRELTRERGGGVEILRRPRLGQHIRRRGEDVRRGERMLRKGVALRPYEIALLAAQGVAAVRAIAAPRVGLLATGDELVEPGRRLPAGKIRNANALALAAALSNWDAVPLYQGIVADEPRALKAALRRALRRCDMLLVSGGVSAGDFDYTKSLLEELGLKTVFWKLAIKPGKPLLFGLLGGKPVFGLPGNPIAAMVCLEEFVRPAVEKLQGRGARHPSYHLEGTVENDYPKDPARRQYLFCRASRRPDGFRLRVIRPQGSAMLGMAVEANALAVAPIGVSLIKEGMSIPFRWLK